MPPTPYRLVFRFGRLLSLGATALLYSLGAGIAHYLGGDTRPWLYFLGLVWVTAFHLAVTFFEEGFATPEREMPGPPRMGDPAKPQAVKLPRRSVFFVLAAGCLTVAASGTVLLMNTGRLAPEAWLIMGLGAAGALLYALPPVRLSASGYGELVQALLLAVLVPAFSFLLHYGELHRYLGMATFPLALLYLAMLLVFELPDYGEGLRLGRRVLLLRMGWEQGVVLHNYLVLGAFVLLAAAAVLGLPRFAVFPALAPLPLGLAQIWYLEKIARGGKPEWNALVFSALALFGGMGYLLALAFWTH